MKEWLAEAQDVLNAGTSPNTAALLRQHGAFFEASKSGPMRNVLPNLEQASRELEENFEGLSSVAERWRFLQQQFAVSCSFRFCLHFRLDSNPNVPIDREDCYPLCHGTRNRKMFV